MNINSDNIEALIVDYFDGTLNEQQSRELDRAIALNPKFRQLFNEYQSALDCTVGEGLPVTIDPEFAEELKQTSDFNEIDTPYFDRLAVLVSECIATKAEQEEYNQMILQDDSKLQSAVLYSYCKIKPNKDLQCPYKNNLKRSQIRPLRSAFAAAAAVLAFLLMCRVVYFSECSIDLARLSGTISVNFAGRNVQVVDNYLFENIENSTPKHMTYANLPYAVHSQSDAVRLHDPEPQSTISPTLQHDDSLIADLCIASVSESKISYPEDILQPITIDWKSIEELDNNGLAISIDFIGEQGIADFKEDKARIHRRINERRSPKICVSYDEDGKKDGVSLLIGNRELKVWSR